MNTFPLIKAKWSNEHIMAAVFLTLVLYHLPLWMENPARIIYFILLTAFGLLIDAIASMLRHHRLWCCVSGAITAAMISLLSVNAPLWGQLLGVAFALIVGKHLQGGTGKNIVNPAMAGLIILLPLFGYPRVFFEASWWLLPAIMLSLAFLAIRPYAGIGFILGMLAAMYLNQELAFANMITYGVFFWGCLVMTDPVTVTSRPAVGGVMGLLAGALPLYIFKTPAAVVLGVLIVNLFSEDIAKLLYKADRKGKAKVRIPKVFPHIDSKTEMIDLTGNEETSLEKAQYDHLTKEVILDRIRKNDVFGMGGAAFSTYRKIMTVLEGEGTDKHLIINGVECDPGLIHDAWLLRNHFTEIVKGVELLRKCVEFQSSYLAVKDKSGLSGSDLIEIVQVQDLYPVGAERILIDAVLGKGLHNDQIPAKEGILVLNVQTIYAISRAVLINKPVESRYLTVASLKEKTAKVVKVKLGMKLQEVMEAVYPDTVNIFAGGGIMQAYLAEEDAVVDKSINFIAAGIIPDYKESPQCSNCKTCVKNCPSGLQVKQIADLVDLGKLEETSKYHAKDCISCGSCSYSCLAGNNLAAKVRTAKEASVADK